MRKWDDDASDSGPAGRPGFWAQKQRRRGCSWGSLRRPRRTPRGQGFLNGVWRRWCGRLCLTPGLPPGGGQPAPGCWRRILCAVPAGDGDCGRPQPIFLGAVAIASLLLQPTDALIQSGLETVQAISDYGKAAASGDVGGPGGLRWNHHGFRPIHGNRHV